METALRDSLFAGITENQILGMRPSDLLGAMKQLALRTKIGDMRIPLDATLTGHGGMSAEQVLLALCGQFENWIKLFSIAVQRRLRYFFHFQLVPYSTRQLMPDYTTMSFLPGYKRKVFPAGARFWDLDWLEVITMGTRLHRLVARDDAKPFPIDHFDLRILLPEVDRATGTVKLGGTGRDEDGNTYARVGLSRMMDFEPGRDPWAVPRNCPEIVDEAIELHAATELGLASGVRDQLEPVFPPICLGFEHPDDIEPENTPQLQYAALENIKDWLRNGKPVSGQYDWAGYLVENFAGVGYDQVTTWQDAAKLLKDQADYVLTTTWANNEVPHDGLTLVPASLFAPNSEQRPFEKAKRIYADMAPHLGRLTIWPNGRETIEQSMSRIQMIRLDMPEIMPQGKSGVWDYDLSSAEIGMTREFV